MVTAKATTYCGEGIRRTKTSSEGFRRFIRDGQNILLEVADTGGTLRRYTHQSDSWGTLLSLHQEQMSRFFGFDGSANTRLLTDENGSVSDGYLYSAFGEERQVSEATDNPLRFGGEVEYYRDEAKRLYVQARHLNVGVGRWLSRDPMAESGSINLYSYVQGNPTNFVDPDGLRRVAYVFIGELPTDVWWKKLYAFYDGSEVSDALEYFYEGGYDKVYIVDRASPAKIKLALSRPDTKGMWFFGHGYTKERTLDTYDGMTSASDIKQWLGGRKLDDAIFHACSVGTNQMKAATTGDKGYFWGTTEAYSPLYPTGTLPNWFVNKFEKHPRPRQRRR